jgi:hypothetical protein
MRQSRATSGRCLTAVALAVAVVLAAACGESGSEPAPEPAAGVAPEVAGSATQFADCADWNQGSEAERRATLLDLRGQLTAQSDPGAESVLPDDRAYELFEQSCQEEYAAHLRLYKLYVRAAAFEPLRP